MCRSMLVSPLLISMACHRVSPPRATATELQGRGRRGILQFALYKWHYGLFEKVTCLTPGQHPEEDDALMSSGFSKTVVRRRGLIVGLRWTGRTVSSVQSLYFVLNCSFNVTIQSLQFCLPAGTVFNQSKNESRRCFPLLFVTWAQILQIMLYWQMQIISS